MTRIETNHFISLGAAYRYYRKLDYFNAIEHVAAKVESGEIVIGCPELKPGERVSVIPGEGRYQIEVQS